MIAHIQTINQHLYNSGMKDIAKRIKQAREKKGMTQAELAAKLNVSPQSVQQWESVSSPSKPKVARIRHLAEMLDVSTNWLLDGSDIADEMFQDLDLDLDALTESLASVFEADKASGNNMPVRTLVDLAVVAYRIGKADGPNDVISELLRLSKTKKSNGTKE